MKNSCGVTVSYGVTFIELVVTMAVAAVVVMLVFAFMKSTSLGIRMQEGRVERVNAMILTRKKMEAVVNRIQSVISVRKDQVEFTIGYSDSIHDITFNGDSLKVDTVLIGKMIKSVNLEIDGNKPGKNVFYWGIEFNNGGWISGAKGFEKKK